MIHMSSSSDLTPILKDWQWQSGVFGVRTLSGHDGRLLLQVRLELGIIQMEADGRPDGNASGGFDLASGAGAHALRSAARAEALACATKAPFARRNDQEGARSC